MVPRARLDAVVKRKISFRFREQNPDPLVAQPVPYSLYQLTYPGSHVTGPSLFYSLTPEECGTMAGHDHFLPQPSSIQRGTTAVRRWDFCQGQAIPRNFVAFLSLLRRIPRYIYFQIPPLIRYRESK
jgi:hypothetical protein